MLSTKKYVSDTTLAKWYDLSKAIIWRWTKEGSCPSQLKLMAQLDGQLRR